jgi:hypothetical protein
VPPGHSLAALLAATTFTGSLRCAGQDDGHFADAVTGFGEGLTEGVGVEVLWVGDDGDELGDLGA